MELSWDTVYRRRTLPILSMRAWSVVSVHYETTISVSALTANSRLSVWGMWRLGLRWSLRRSSTVVSVVWFVLIRCSSSLTREWPASTWTWTRSNSTTSITKRWLLTSSRSAPMSPKSAYALAHLWLSVFTLTFLFVYRVGQKRKPPTDLSINRIKTCRRSYTVSLKLNVEQATEVNLRRSTCWH